MSIYVYYGIAHIGVVVSICFSIFSIVKYRYLKRKKDVFLAEWIHEFGLFCCLAPTIGIIGSDFIMRHNYTSFNASMIGALIFIIFAWILGIIIVIISNYYIKIEENEIIVHSIWFSKIVISKELVNKSKSFQVFNDSNFKMLQYIVLSYEGHFLKIGYDPLIHEMKSGKLISFCKEMKIGVINKNKYEEFKTQNEVASLNRLFRGKIHKKL